MTRYRLCIGCIAIVFLAAGCASYERHPVPFKMPSSYPNATKVAGATIAAKAYDDPREAKKAFGWDIRDAGLYPVQIIFDNLSDNSLEVEPSQTFLVDGKGNMWSILDSEVAYDRVAKKSDISRIARAGVKPGLLGGLGGALIGAAVGIVSDENVLEAAGKGAAAGAAAGATLGGANAVGSESAARSAISKDLMDKSLENRAILPRTVAHGFIFFPGEAEGARELRLHLRVVETGDLYTVRLQL